MFTYPTNLKLNGLISLLTRTMFTIFAHALFYQYVICINKVITLYMWREDCWLMNYKCAHNLHFCTRYTFTHCLFGLHVIRFFYFWHVLSYLIFVKCCVVLRVILFSRITQCNLLVETVIRDSNTDTLHMVLDWKSNTNKNVTRCLIVDDKQYFCSTTFICTYNLCWFP